MNECLELLERLARIARLRPDPEYCKDIESIRQFLGGLAKARADVENLQPLYHVWEEASRLREPGDQGYNNVDLEELLPPGRIQEGHVKLPWKGRT